MKKNFITGFVSGAVAFSMIGAFAANMITTPNTYEVQLDGKDVNIEGYNVDDYTYFKLRDISDAVGGFDVGFSNDTITIDTDTAAEPTPTVKPSTTDLSPLPELTTKQRDGVQYVSKYDINDMLESIGLSDYEFFGHDFCKKDDLLNPILTDIPLYEHDIELIPLDYYVSTIIPTINSLR